MQCEVCSGMAIIRGAARFQGNMVDCVADVSLQATKSNKVSLPAKVRPFQVVLLFQVPARMPFPDFQHLLAYRMRKMTRKYLQKLAFQGCVIGCLL